MTEELQRSFDVGSCCGLVNLQTELQQERPPSGQSTSVQSGACFVFLALRENLQNEKWKLRLLKVVPERILLFTSLREAARTHLDNALLSCEY